MLKRFLAIFAILIFPFYTSFSQTYSDQLSQLDWSIGNSFQKEEPDFIWNAQGKKVFGKIARGYNQTDYDQIQLESNGTKTTYLPKDIQGFGLGNGQVFHSRPVADLEGKYFVQVLISGPVELSVFKGRYFIDNGIQNIELEAYYAKKEVNGSQIQKYTRPFIMYLKQYLDGDCGVPLYPEIDRMPFNELALIRIFTDYYTCTGATYKLHVEKVPFVRTSPTLGVGINQFTLAGVSQIEEAKAQFANNFGYSGFVGVRFHEFRRLPRFATELRLEYSIFNSQVVSSFENNQVQRTGTEDLKETAVYIPWSITYDVVKKGGVELYLGMSIGYWIYQITTENEMVDEKILGTNETFLYERPLTTPIGKRFMPGIKAGTTLSIFKGLNLFAEIEANQQKEYYQIVLSESPLKPEYSRNKISFRLGFEF